MAAATVVASTTVVSPAQADTDQCDSGQMCFWHNQSYGGRFFYRTSSDGDLGGDSDEAHALYNRTSKNWIVYDDKNFDSSDRRFCVRPGRRVADLGNSSLKFGDKISSAKKLTGGCPAEIPVI
ncbi:hypothetical protein GCM10028771_17790 [Nocardioides marmoraquaticus]